MRNGKVRKVMKKIDIYGTLGPACAKQELLQEMFACGMTGIRLNLSHVGLEQCKEWLERFHQAAENVGVVPKLLIDLQGPELRLGEFEACELQVGEEALLGSGGIPVPEIIFDGIQPGQQILLDDGKILLEVEKIEQLEAEGHLKEGTVLYCKILRGGTLKPRKSIALPGMQIYPPTLTESDLQNLMVAKAYGVTGVMLPFVRNAEDLQNLREVLINANSTNIQIFAKIENMDGVEKLSELLPFADEFVIARGDLGNAMPLWELPGVQYQIAEKCKEAGKPYMVVTQMLASMETSSVPTRAEVSDIFYAVYHGASSVMLTGETAAGKYPLEAMEYMCKTVETALKISE